ncbi:methyltransferase domain-containing protein [Paracoccus sp. NSM]|uniref:methyltransferase domain-containing protein n=1 Tax=Paracoccus sp. NSM TaxID=3457784 RepID=UPI0040363FA5
MGFSAAWLALREPADRAARDAGLLARAAAIAGPRPVILDLGCGTGSTLRAMTPHLPAETLWRLADLDAGLLALAAAEAPGRVTTHRLDLRDLNALPLDGATLVTASALLDLMPAPWIEALAAHLLAARLPFYAVLSYDGVMEWQPPLPGDAAITRAFNDHQRRDKGLGPALGPTAASRAPEIFAAAGFSVTTGDSPWRIGPDQQDLHSALIEGIATAAAEQGAAGAADWAARRVPLAASERCVIGHGDMLAVPPGATHPEPS